MDRQILMKVKRFYKKEIKSFTGHQEIRRRLSRIIEHIFKTVNHSTDLSKIQEEQHKLRDIIITASIDSRLHERIREKNILNSFYDNLERTFIHLFKDMNRQEIKKFCELTVCISHLEIQGCKINFP